MTINHVHRVAIIGAGASGLMAAQVLAEKGVSVVVYEQMPTAGRKILMAGKTGLNISHNEPLELFISRYRASENIAPIVRQFHAEHIRQWMTSLGVQSYVGSSGRIFPVHMKASVLLRAWLQSLQQLGVQIHYRHRCTLVHDDTICVVDESSGQASEYSYDAIILACGGGSYARLGGDAKWQNWFHTDQLTALYASNVGVVREWSDYMQPCFGQPLKRVLAWVQIGDKKYTAQGDIIITKYGLESGVIYQLNHALRQQKDMTLYLDLLPNKSSDELARYFTKYKKQSLNNLFRKIGLDSTKISLLRECSDKKDWQDWQKMLNHIKCLKASCDDFRPMDEAISTGGGVSFEVLGENLQLKDNPRVFCAGEMVDWDAPTGGYLLTACLAMGQWVGQAVFDYLQDEQ